MFAKCDNGGNESENDSNNNGNGDDDDDGDDNNAVLKTVRQKDVDAQWCM